MKRENTVRQNFFIKKLGIIDLYSKTSIAYLLIWGTLSCTTSSQVSWDYKTKLNMDETPIVRGSPVILFLIDGLGYETWKNVSEKGQIKNTNLFFNSKTKGYTQFPSLTFPNVSSILMTESMAINPITHNQLYADFENEGDRSLRKIYNLETPFGLKKVNKAIQSQLIFSNLSEQNLKTVSLAHSFYEGTDAKLDLKLDSSLNYITNNAFNVDELTLKSLETLLNEKNRDKIPDFIFVHLVSYDFMSHEYGPYSKKALKQLTRLDQLLKNIYQQLIQKEIKQGLYFTALLTSDHGFIKPKNRIHDFDEKIEKKLFEILVHDKSNSKFNRVDFDKNFASDLTKPPHLVQNDFVVIEEGRLASINFKKGADLNELFNVASSFINQKPIGIVAFRRLNKIWILNKQNLVTVDYRDAQGYSTGGVNCGDDLFQIAVQIFNWNNFNGPDSIAKENLDVMKLWYCPLDTESVYKYKNYPYFFRQISNYFKSPNHSDILMIADDGYAFSDEYKGFHGALTSEEIEVPILSRNAKLFGNPIFNYQLLKFLKK